MRGTTLYWNQELTPGSNVIQSGVWLFTAQKPIKRQVGGKASVLYFACWQLGCRGGGFLPKADTTPTTDNQWGRGFIDRGRGLQAETAQPALTVIFTLAAQRSAASSWLFPQSSSSVPRSVCSQVLEASSWNRNSLAYVMPTVWLSCSSRLPPGRDFTILKTAHSIPLRILFTTHEEELNVLDYV